MFRIQRIDTSLQHLCSPSVSRHPLYIISITYNTVSWGGVSSSAFQGRKTCICSYNQLVIGSKWAFKVLTVSCVLTGLIITSSLYLLRGGVRSTHHILWNNKWTVVVGCDREIKSAGIYTRVVMWMLRRFNVHACRLCPERQAMMSCYGISCLKFNEWKIQAVYVIEF